MTSAEVLSIIGALTTSIVTIITALRVGGLKTQVNESVYRQDKTADDVKEKLAEIHTLTNSNLTQVHSDLEMANDQIKELQKLVASLQRKVKNQ